MRLQSMMLIAACAWPGFTQGAEREVTTLAPVALTVRVNSDGTPSNVACGPTVGPALCPVLTRAVSGWRFTPGQRDFAPAALDIWLTLNLVAKPTAEGFSLHATHAAVAPRSADAAGEIDPTSRAMNPPAYPRDEIRQGDGAIVILELFPQPGSPHPRVGQAWIGGKPARDKNPFVQASRDAAAKWKFAALPPDQLSTCVSIEFTLGKPKPGKPSPSTAPCAPTYKDGFVPPKLLTDPLTATF